MYCVKCGVRLQEGAERCPLCDTPVWNPEALSAEKSYPDTLPEHYRESSLPLAITMTVVCAVAAAVILTICYRLYGELRWGGYAAWGVLLFYITAILPCWFRKPRAEVFVPAGFTAAALYTLYVCEKTGGNWFLRFALPVLVLCCVLTTGMVCLLKYVRRGRLFIFGGFFLALGGVTVLAEFFERLAFGTKMFHWSLYTLVGFGAVGVFLLLAGMVRPLRRALERRCFF